MILFLFFKYNEPHLRMFAFCTFTSKFSFDCYGLSTFSYKEIEFTSFSHLYAKFFMGPNSSLMIKCWQALCYRWAVRITINYVKWQVIVLNFENMSIIFMFGKISPIFSPTLLFSKINHLTIIESVNFNINAAGPPRTWLPSGLKSHTIGRSSRRK